MSKGLDVLKELKHWKETNNENGAVWLPLFVVEDIEKALVKAQEQEKVLSIIKEKNVDIFRFRKLDFNTFNQLQRSCNLPELTEEEFNTVREWAK